MITTKEGCLELLHSVSEIKRDSAKILALGCDPGKDEILRYLAFMSTTQSLTLTLLEGMYSLMIDIVHKETKQ